ncbi:YgfZ/GcvT domain-containing protein [Altererythrobacter sp. Root672]|uniref:CAF17-like 4Fe-4S cluster assembly/insertion protein YgfZ n=1 Tax=Altererythrobacter sp. Root672 TaxID=1736584 RepID=UPI0006FE75A7|nr:aminomethyltransferase [Altererythrobacter sp. Root672]KRA82827.1 aminomethyltransferase [Altererythrobacter sp. Root672]
MANERLFSRAVVRVTPEDPAEDAAGFLQGLVTNDVTGELPAYAGLLTPQGKALFDFIVWPTGHGALLLDCEAEAAEDLVRRLSLYRLRRKIGIAVDPSLGVYWQAEVGDGGAADPRLPGLGQRWIAAVSDEDHSVDAEWQRHRLALGVPEGRAELGDVLWLETNAMELGGVSFSKGCYIGQENTARMNWRQKINRRLLVVPLNRSEEKRRKAAYPELGFAVDHLRVEDIPPALLPQWLELAEPSEGAD